MNTHDHALGCSSRTALHGAIQTFAQQLRGVLCSVADNVDRLQRQTEMQPGTSAREFRLVVQDLEEELSELTQEVALLQRFSMDAISFEELLGHCTSLYKSNRDTAIRVHQRLQQAGCSLPDGGLQQPEEPLQHMQQPSRGMSSAAAVTFSANVRGMEGHDDGWLTERDGGGGSAVASSLRNRQQTPGFPRGGQRRQAYDDDEEDEEQEGDGRVAHAGLGQQQPAAAKPHARAACDENTDPQHGADRQQPAVRPLTSNLLPPTAAKQTSFRPSMDSRASSTPDMFALSPSLLALQHKYGSGGSDMAGAPMPASMPASSAEPSPPSNDDMDADPPSMPTTAPGRPESAAGGSSNGGGTQPWSQQAQANSGASQSSGGQAQQQSSSGRQTDGTAAQQQQQQQQQQYMQYSQQYTPLYQEEDTLNLYQELIRSKGVPAPRNIVRKSATPKKQLQQQQEQQQQQQQQRMAAAAEAAGAGFEDTEMSEQAPAAAGTAVQGVEAAAVTQQQQQQQGGAKGKAQAVALASALEQLEDLWVSSGQAALTPSRARRPEGDLGTPSRSRGTTPARSRGATPSRSRPQHNHFTREAARAASEAQAREAAAVSQQQQQQQQLQQHAAMRGSLDAGVAMQQHQQQQAGSGSSLSSLSSASAQQQQQQQPASGSSNTITPALPPSLVPGFGLALQMQGSSGPRVLSPGTSQLLSAVYGSAAIQQAGLSAIQPERQQSLPQQQPQPPASAAAVGAQLYTAPAPTQPQAGSNAGFAGNVGSQVPAPTSVPSNAQHEVATSDPAAVPEAVAAGYAALPAFCRSQLSLEQLDEGLQQLRRLVDNRRYAGGDANAFSLADLEQQGMAPAKSKVFINCLVKLGCAELQKATGGGFGYVLK